MDTKLPRQYKGAFKDADIRGVYGEEIDDDLTYRIGRAFVTQQGASEVVVGRDVRYSSPALFEAFVTGVRDAGADVLDIGLVTSPMLYFASGKYELPGVMITASHSPPAYNGLKLVAPGAVPLTAKTGLNSIKSAVAQLPAAPVSPRGRVRSRHIRNAYRQHILKGVNRRSVRDLKLVADAGNGMASILLPLLTEALPLSIDTLFGELDGRFPNRGSDPTIRKHQAALRKALRTGSYDFGIAFDGDADRIAFLDEQGRYVNCAVIGALIAEHLIEQEPGAGCVYTNLTSRVYEEAIKAAGGKAIRARVGHAFLKEKIAATGAVFGCEHSGHFFFRDFYHTDSVVLTLRYVMEIYAAARANGQSFSELVATYQRYHQLEDVVIPVHDKAAVLQAVHAYLETQHPDAKVQKFDGLYVSTDIAWGAVKPSVTEHAIKVMFEGPKKRDAALLQDELVAFVTKVA